MVDDKTGRIFLLAKVFPPPTVRDVLWTVETGDGVRRMVRPGDKRDELSAEVIQREDDDTYQFVLDINGDREEILATNVTLALTTGQKLSETKFDMQLVVSISNMIASETVKQLSIAGTSDNTAHCNYRGEK